MKRGSTRSSYEMRQTGGDSDGISLKPSKKLKKLSSVGETYQSTSGKRVKLPKKVFNGCDSANQSSVPRKLRSAMKKRHDESVSPSLGTVIRRSEKPSKDHITKLKFETDEQPPSTMSESITEQITEDEKDVMAALLAIAGIVTGNDEINLKIKTSEAEASGLQEKYDLKRTCEAATVTKSDDLVQKHVHIQDLNEVTNTLDIKKVSEDFTDGATSRKRCAMHVYICRIIEDLQFTEGKVVNSHDKSNRRDYADAKTDTMPETIINGGKITNKTPWHVGTVEVGSPSVAKNHGGVPVPHQSDAASQQVAALPYFGNPLYDPSQWSRPVFPKQLWMNPFPGGRNQNGGHETMFPLSGSYVGTSSGSKYVQPSLRDVLGAKKDARNMTHQLQYKMQLSHRSSGYEENRGSLFVDGSPILKLSL